MRKGKKKKAIIAALIAKGYQKREAKNIAVATLKKQQEARDRRMTPWEVSVGAQLSAGESGRQKAANLHKQAAINKPSAMTGKIVVVRPQGGA